MRAPFQIKQGDLILGDEVRARQVSITVDGGSLTVAGRIDASGFQPGIIRLAARGDLNLLGTLDAHGAGLRRDSHGQIIDSPNRAGLADVEPGHADAGSVGQHRPARRHRGRRQRRARAARWT